MNPHTWLASVALTAGAAIAGHWDDETFLGRGPMAAVGASIAVTRFVDVESEVGYGTYHRSAGYLESRGKTKYAAARAVLTLAPSQWAVRPFVSAGGAWHASSGHFISPGIEGRAVRTNWTTPLAPSWEAGVGAEIRVSSRFSLRPEGRWTITARGSSDRNTIEAPLMSLRGGVTAIWRLQK